MQRLLLLVILIGLIAWPAGEVAASPGFQVDSPFGVPLCLPGMPLVGNCLPYGPVQTIIELQEAGFPWPPRDLPAAPPAAELGQMPVFVAKINLPEDQPAPIYGSFEDAVSLSNPVDQLAPGGLRFISYVDRVDHGGKAYLQLSSGRWMRAAPAAIPDYQGLLFYENPRNAFGWVVDQTPSYRSPSFGAATTGKEYVREDLIQVFNIVEAEGVTWYQISLEEWVNSQKARVVTLNTEPPAGVTTNRWIEINLLEQTMMVYEDGRLMFATLVATGVENSYTKPGVFKIYEKIPLGTMQGSFEADRSDFYYLQDVPWLMYYDEARALHTAYWRTFFGYPQSHGCINLSPGDANWLFQWADEGDFVWVHDPSGKTPTDDDLYGPGAP